MTLTNTDRQHIRAVADPGTAVSISCSFRPLVINLSGIHQGNYFTYREIIPLLLSRLQKRNLQLMPESLFLFISFFFFKGTGKKKLVEKSGGGFRYIQIVG